MRPRTVFPAIVSTLTLFLCVGGAAAQNLATTYVMVPKPGAASTLESALRAHSRWREENRDPWAWDVWQVVNGENVGEFHARSTGHSWSDYDSYNASDFAARANDHFNATVAPLLASVESYITEAHPDLSMVPEAGTPVMLATVSTYYLKPGMEQAFRETVARFREAAPGHGWTAPYVVSTTVNGGQGPAMGIVGLCPTWACMAGPETSPEEVLLASYGDEEGGRLLRQFSDAYTRLESFIAARRPDLSVPAGR